MTDLKDFLKDMVSAPGLSGHETPVRRIIEKKWETLVDEMQVSKLGSLEGLKKGSGDGPRPSLLIAAHMDAIGLIVTRVSEGFISFTSVGGVDPRVLLGQPVLVHGRETLEGVIVQPNDDLVADHTTGSPVGLQSLYVDVGLSPEKVSQMVRSGDLISFDQKPLDLEGDTLAGHTMDDRTAVAALTHCLEILQTRIHKWDVWAVATVQEETSFGGAYTSSFGLNPDLGIAVDVTHAKGPGTSESTIADLGKGLVLGFGPNIHTFVYNSFKKLADEMEIPYQVEVMPSHSGTDGYAVQVAGSGRPSMVISIPLRYMHTPVELVSMKDIKRVGRLLAEFITTLEENYLDKISWDEEDEKDK